ncbi:hypothetical protein CK203_105109 [Vitis vinifera]|uniref:Uncharacterized protein n=1 Tax=Vitis vinifera TaxID=29760 RepID=A0A438CNQ5_VITVI|nr:hypothetical protein CK203_105109 [Vitis vinifera]
MSATQEATSSGSSEAVSTEKAEGNAISFAKEQFNAGLWFPLRHYSRNSFTQIPPAYIHPNTVRVLMGSILSMLFNWTLAVGVTELGLNEGRSEGTCAGPGCLGWSSGASGEAIFPKPFVGASGFGQEGPRSRTLLTARNLLAVVRESQAYIINILPRKLPNKVVSGEHYVLKDLPFYKEVKKADAEKREHSLTIGRGGKRRELCGRLLGKNAAQPPFQYRLYGNPNGGNGGRKPESAFLRAKPSCPCTGEGASFKEVAFGTQLKVRPHRAASRSIPGNHRSHCSSVQDDHPEGSETEMATETPAVPVVVPDEGTPGETQSAENEGAPDLEEESPSNASSGGVLLMMRLASLLALLAMQTGEWSSRHGQQHDLFTDLLRTADYMKAFASQRKNSENQLRLRLEEPKPVYPPLGGQRGSPGGFS